MNHTVRERKKSFAGVLAVVLSVVLLVGIPEVRALAAGVEITSATVMHALAKVNVRREPDMSAEILGQLEFGEKIFAVELTQEGWYRVAYQGETGYIRKDFLEVYTAGEDWDEAMGEDILPHTQPGEQEEAARENSVGQGTREESSEGSSAGEGSQAEAPGGSSVGQGGLPEGLDSSSASQMEGEEKSSKSGISNVVILGLTGAVILAYAVFQVLKERGKESGPTEQGRGKGDSQKSGGRNGLTYLELEEED